MARRFTLQIIMDLATRIGANPAKAISRSNISFLGKGPTKNPLFQSRLAGLENATEANLGKPETLFAAIDDAVNWMKDGKLNSIQSEILGHNLSGIERILHPPPLPVATVSQFPVRGAGIESLNPKNLNPLDRLGKNVIDRRGSAWYFDTDRTAAHKAALKRFPKETHKFMGRPLKDKDFSEIDRMIMEGKIPDARGRTWNLKETGPQRYDRLTGLGKQGPEVFNAALNQKTGMSRAIARQILQQDTRLKLKPEELFMLKEGKGEPLDLMRKYYGRSMMNLDEFLDNAAFRGFTNADEAAATALKEIELIPQFAQGGLARILEV